MTNKKNPINKKSMSDRMVAQAVTNRELICVDCALKFDCAGKCEAYPIIKPVKVFEKGECDEYVKE